MALAKCDLSVCYLFAVGRQLFNNLIKLVLEMVRQAKRQVAEDTARFGIHG